MPEPVDSEDIQLLRLSRKILLAEDTFLLELVHPEGVALQPFEAGAHVSMETPEGQWRDYSLSNDPADNHRYVLAIKSEPQGSGSVRLAEDSQPSDLFKVSQPKNNFPLQAADEYLFIAGGIGITPIISMMRHLKRNGMDNFCLVYCTRSPETTAFLEELSGPEFASHVTLHHDAGDPANLFDLRPLFETVRPVHVYCCGPGVMMMAIKELSKHWPEDAIHMEDFSGNW